jgi:hypothetical protein
LASAMCARFPSTPSFACARRPSAIDHDLPVVCGRSAWFRRRATSTTTSIPFAVAVLPSSAGFDGTRLWAAALAPGFATYSTARAERLPRRESLVDGVPIDLSVLYTPTGDSEACLLAGSRIPENHRAPRAVNMMDYGVPLVAASVHSSCGS